MASKSLVLLGLFALLFVVSEVAAVSERQSGTVKLESEETVRPNQYGGGQGSHGGYNLRGNLQGLGFCPNGCCQRSRVPRSCSRCCSYAGEAVQTQPGQ